MCLKVVLVLLHVVVAGVLFLLDTDLIRRTRENPWYSSPIPFSFLLFLFLFLCSFFSWFFLEKLVNLIILILIAWRAISTTNKIVSYV